MIILPIYREVSDQLEFLDKKQILTGLGVLFNLITVKSVIYRMKQ